jgi:hypothetical protein
MCVEEQLGLVSKLELDDFAGESKKISMRGLLPSCDVVALVFSIVTSSHKVGLLVLRWLIEVVFEVLEKSLFLFQILRDERLLRKLSRNFLNRVVFLLFELNVIPKVSPWLLEHQRAIIEKNSICVVR